MTEPPTAFTARVLASARALVKSTPEGFRHVDLAKLLGVGADASGADRLRRALKRLRATGVLASSGRGVFQAGPCIDDVTALGAGVEIATGVDRFLAENGGMGRVKEMQTALELDADQARTLFRVLEAGRYVQLPRLLDQRRWWALPEDEATRTPLPGWRLDQDTALVRAAAGLPWRGDGWKHVDQRRQEIGRGVRQARRRLGIDEDTLLAGRVGAEFQRCLEVGQSWVLDAEGNLRFGDWWRRRVDEVGADEALAAAWCDFEYGRRQGEPCAGDNLDALFWRTLADHLGEDAADLSRGRRPGSEAKTY